jgi:hypothetical protein
LSDQLKTIIKKKKRRCGGEEEKRRIFSEKKAGSLCLRVFGLPYQGLYIEFIYYIILYGIIDGSFLYFSSVYSISSSSVWYVKLINA